MQLSEDADLSRISQKTGFSIFELPDADFAAVLPKAYHFKPSEKAFYTKSDIDAISALVHTKQSESLIIVLEDGEEMNEAAANTFLKTLEEPGENVHFVFLVRNSSKILPTIKSRAQRYYQVRSAKLTEAPNVPKDILDLAKQYLTCPQQNLPKFCEKIAKDKDNARDKAIKLVDATIQLAYKSYFITKQTKYLDKLESLLTASDNLKAGGHIKLQLIVAMI